LTELLLNDDSKGSANLLASKNTAEQGSCKAKRTCKVSCIEVNLKLLLSFGVIRFE